MRRNWLMRRLTQHEVTDADLDEAHQAAMDAKRRLDEVAERGGEVSRVANELRMYRERNGFGEMLTRSMRLRRLR